MRKLLGAMLLVITLFGSGQANAMVCTNCATEATSFITSATNTLSMISGEVVKVKTTLMEEFNKLAWVQQAKDMIESIQKLKEQIDEIMGLRDDVMGIMTGARDLGGFISNNLNKGPDNIDYRYADKLPQGYLSPINCSGMSADCTMSGDGYVGKATPGNSKNIRDALRVNTGFWGVAPVNIKDLSNEAAEQNAQEIAIIQAMAQEAYVQANNRIEKIEELEAKINGATSAKNTKAASSGAGTTGATSATGITSTPATADTGSADAAKPAKTNDLKYIADLQAQIQAQQALLANEQNKLTALAILQQSQRDAYEQRKKEIAAYVVNGGESGGLVETVERSAIAAGQAAAYAAVVALYD